MGRMKGRMGVGREKAVEKAYEDLITAVLVSFGDS